MLRRQRRGVTMISDRKRAPKAAYQFHLKRHGDTITCATAKDRAYAITAFANWKRGKPGTLHAMSKKIDAGFLITFAGISPAEATAARLSNGGDI